MLNYKEVIAKGLNVKTSTKWQGKLAGHVMGWFGEPQTGDPSKVHRVSYQSNSPSVIENQLDNMQEVGIDVVILTWQGPAVAPYLHLTAVNMSAACSQRDMGFCLLLDPWICKQSANKEQAIQAALNDPTTQVILNAKSYIPEKYILDFSTGANLATLGTMFPTLKFLANQQGFSWPNITTNPIANLAAQNTNPAMKMPGVYKNFFDGGYLTLANGNGANGAGRDYEESIWGPGTGARRVLDHQGGLTFLQSIDVLPVNPGYVCIVTWNDYDEDTAFEHEVVALTGIAIG